MAIYRKAWTDRSGTKWRYRLDIVPYDETLSGAVTTLSDTVAAFIEVGAVESALDELPYGLEQPKQMSLRMALNKLPSALRTYIRTKQSGTARNLFLYWCDRGTAGVTWTLEFAGVQAKIAGTSYSKADGAMMTTVELVDALQWTMASTTMADALAAWAGSGTRHGTYYDVRFNSIDRTEAYHDARVSATGWSDGFYTATFNDAVHAVRTGITAKFTANAARTTNATLGATGQAADLMDGWLEMVNSCTIFYKAADALPRAVSTALTSNTLRIVSDVLDESLAPIGGMMQPGDKYGWAAYESVWDWLKDMCETHNAKATYLIRYAPGGGAPYLYAEWQVTPPKATHSGAAVPQLSTDKRLNEDAEVTETEAGIGKVEVRWESENDKDVTEVVYNTGAARADRSFNVNLLMHNLPTYKPDYAETSWDNDQADMLSKGFFQTNIYGYLQTTGEPWKVHEAVRFYSDASTSTLYEPAEADAPLPIGDDGNAPTNWGLWCNAVQNDATTNGGMMRGLAAHLATLFGDDDVATVELKWRISDYGADVLNDALGTVHELTGEFATDLPHLGWTTACVVAVTADHANNEATIKYILMP